MFIRKAICLIAVFHATNAFALDLDGKYRFDEQGCSGQMLVQENSSGMDPHIMVKIETVCTERAHTCDFEAKGTRIISTDNEVSTQFLSVNNDDLEPAKFEIDFNNDGATINVSDRGPFCGMNAYYAGKWPKDDGSPAPQPTTEAVTQAQTREDRIMIEKMCRFSSSQSYGLYADAQKGVSSENSYKNTLSKLKKKKLDINNEVFAQNLVDEIYGLYYKLGRLNKNDKKKNMEEQYFRSCMNNSLKK